VRVVPFCCVAVLAAQAAYAQPQSESPAPVAILDVPFVSQSELLCGGAAAAMVLRYWGERELAAEAFAHLVDRSAAGIRTDALVAELRRRGWNAQAAEGDEAAVRTTLGRGRPVMLLIEDRPSAFHYVVAVAWHDRGVVFHDPARGPFRVMSTGEFTRRWRAARRWMAVVEARSVPRATESAGPALPEVPAPRDPTYGPRASRPASCDEAVAEGVRVAQSQQLDEAERVLARAIACPGATRELAGIRILQKRWAEAADLASAAVAADRSDGYAWKVLATSRFVQDDRLGALDAWNAIGEPRIDLIRIDGLTHTRHPAVERLIDARPGELLTAARFARARRQLAELPAAASTRLEYVPVASGLAELRGAVVERAVVPHGTATLATTALRAAVMREVQLTSGAVLGGGEQLVFGYRFWPHRRRVNAGIHAPAPWGGLWQLDAFAERQPFTRDLLPRAERTGVRLGASDWVTGHLRWGVAGGVDEWPGQNLRAAVSGRLHWASLDDRVDTIAGARAWPGSGGFSTVGVAARVRSSVDAGPRRTTPAHGLVLVATGAAQLATRRTPPDLWPAADTGHARAPLARAHPLLDAGQLRVERLGRALVQASLEGRRWWRVGGPVRAAVATFTDVARTTRRWDGSPLVDIDAGVGGRLEIDGMPGVFRVDLAKGLRDGATAVSVGYEPWTLVLE